MASAYMIQVVHTGGGVVVQWAPGQAVERAFETELVKRILAKGVGIGKTQTQVAKAVRAAIDELLLDLKAQVPPL